MRCCPNTSHGADDSLRIMNFFLNRNAVALLGRDCTPPNLAPITARMTSCGVSFAWSEARPARNWASTARRGHAAARYVRPAASCLHAGELSARRDAESILRNASVAQVRDEACALLGENSSGEDYAAACSAWTVAQPPRASWFIAGNGAKMPRTV